jgi:hypothetical protein
VDKSAFTFFEANGPAFLNKGRFLPASTLLTVYHHSILSAISFTLCHLYHSVTATPETFLSFFPFFCLPDNIGNPSK